MWYKCVKSSYEFSGHQEPYFIFGNKTEAIMVELLLSTTFGNSKKIHHQISFKIGPEADLNQIKQSMESIEWLFFWDCMDCSLQIDKNVVMFFKDGCVAVGWCCLLYKNIIKKNGITPPEQVANYIVNISTIIININKIKMDIYFLMLLFICFINGRTLGSYTVIFVSKQDMLESKCVVYGRSYYSKELQVKTSIFKAIVSNIYQRNMDSFVINMAVYAWNINVVIWWTLVFVKRSHDDVMKPLVPNTSACV